MAICVSSVKLRVGRDVSNGVLSCQGRRSAGSLMAKNRRGNRGAVHHPKSVSSQRFESLFSSSISQAHVLVMRYTKLSVADREIRLIEVEPENDATRPVKCLLSPVSLNARPSYEALSYVWGDVRATEKIYLEGESVEVGKALAIALRNLRQPHKKVTLWVDSISINQDNAEEKAQQIPLMGDIYHQALNVVVWLGPEAEDSNEVMEMVEYIGGRSIVSQDLPAPLQSAAPALNTFSPRLWSSLDRFLHRPWWYRIWTHQEVVLAKRAMMVCGDKSLDWNFFRLLPQGINLYLRAFDRHISTDTKKLWQSVSESCNVIALKGDHRSLLKDHGIPLPVEMLSRLIMETGHLEATYDHDHLYGLYGLVENQHLPKPDYSKDITQVHIDVAYNFMKSSKRLDHLKQSGCGLGLHNSIPNNPSWLVWNTAFVKEGCEPAFPFVYGKYSASAIRAGDIDIDPDGRTIRVQSFHKDTIQCLRRYECIKGFPVPVGACQHLNEEQPGDKSFTCSKHVSDNMLQALKAPPIMYEGFHRYPSDNSLFGRVFQLSELQMYPTGIHVAEALFRTVVADIDEMGRLLKPEDESRKLLQPAAQSLSEAKEFETRVSSSRYFDDPESQASAPTIMMTDGVDGKYFANLDPRTGHLVHRYAEIFAGAGVDFTIWFEFVESFLIAFGLMRFEESWLCFRGLDENIYPFNPLRPRQMEKEIILEPFVEAVVRACRGRQLLITSAGYLGLAPQGAVPGDIIAVIAGCQVPMVLREEESHYRVIGECFVMGLMRGELDQDEILSRKGKELRLR